MASAHLDLVDGVLLLVSEARERAEGAAKQLRNADGEHHLVEALDEADRELLRIHKELHRFDYFGDRGDRTMQLEL
jgi:hypothetical protein